MTKLDPVIAELVGKKGYPKPHKKEKARPTYALDPRYKEIIARSHEMSDDEIYRAIKKAGLLKDYPIFQKGHEPTASDFAHGGRRPKSRPDDKRGGAREGSGPKKKWLKMRVGDKVRVARYLNQAGVEPHYEEWELIRNDGDELEFRTPLEFIVLGRPFSS